MPVYGEGANNLCRPTSISGALATASAGETTIYVTAPVVKIEQPTALNLEQVLKSFSPSGWRKTITLFCFFFYFSMIVVYRKTTRAASHAEVLESAKGKRKLPPVWSLSKSCNGAGHHSSKYPVRLERHESTVTLRERQQLEEISKTISCFR
jgi:hypothetical protein